LLHEPPRGFAAFTSVTGERPSVSLPLLPASRRAEGAGSAASVFRLSCRVLREIRRLSLVAELEPRPPMAACWTRTPRPVGLPFPPATIRGQAGAERRRFPPSRRGAPRWSRCQSECDRDEDARDRPRCLCGIFAGGRSRRRKAGTRHHRCGEHEAGPRCPRPFRMLRRETFSTFDVRVLDVPLKIHGTCSGFVMMFHDSQPPSTRGARQFSMRW